MSVGCYTRALTALASKAQAIKSGAALPSEHGGPDIHLTASSCSSDESRVRLIIVGEIWSASLGE